MAKGIKKDEFISMLLKTKHYTLADIEKGLQTGHIKRYQPPKKKPSFWKSMISGWKSERK